MPIKKNKYNARFPPARIKKIMQIDEEIGKVAAAVPVIISRSLELFVEDLVKKTYDITFQRHARTLTPSHIKMCVGSEARFDFLKDLVSSVPDLQGDCDDQQPQDQQQQQSKPKPQTNSSTTISNSHKTKEKSDSKETQRQQPQPQQQQPQPQQQQPLPRQISTGPKPRGRKRKLVLDDLPSTDDPNLSPILPKLVVPTFNVKPKSPNSPKTSKKSSKTSKKLPKSSKKSVKEQMKKRTKNRKFVKDDSEEFDAINVVSHSTLNVVGNDSENDAKIFANKTDSRQEPNEKATLKLESGKSDATICKISTTSQNFAVSLTSKEESSSIPDTSASIDQELCSTSKASLPQTFSSAISRNEKAKPSLLSVTPKLKSFSSVTSSSSAVSSPVRTNHIPMHLVSATAMATAKPTTYHRNLSFAETTCFPHRSEQQPGLAFALSYQIPSSQSAGSESKSQTGLKSSAAARFTSFTTPQPPDQQVEPEKSKSVLWSSHGEIDEDYDA